MPWVEGLKIAASGLAPPLSPSSGAASVPFSPLPPATVGAVRCARERGVLRGQGRRTWGHCVMREGSASCAEALHCTRGGLSAGAGGASSAVVARRGSGAEHWAPGCGALAGGAEHRAPGCGASGVERGALGAGVWPVCGVEPWASRVSRLLEVGPAIAEGVAGVGYEASRVKL